MAKRGPKGPITQQHLDALAEGRRLGVASRKQDAVIHRYLKALETAGAQRRKRGRVPQPPSRPEVWAKLIEQSNDPVTRLKHRGHLHAAEEYWDSIDGAEVELAAALEGFIEQAAAYGERLGVTYWDWAEEGVPDDVLRKAGIKR
jgi:hypothetical protein